MSDNEALDVNLDSQIELDMNNIDNVVDQFAKQMVDGDPDVKQSAEEDEPEDDEDEDDEIEDSEDSADDEDDDLFDGDDDEDEDSEDEDDAPIEISDDTIIDIGDDKTATVAELKDSVMFKADHTKKTQELKTAREEVEQMQNATMSRMYQEVTKYQEMLDKAGTIDMVALADSDPVQYQKVQASVIEINKRIEEEHAQLAKFTEYQQAARQKEIDEAMPIIKEAIPGWGQEIAQEILTHYESQDLSDASRTAIQAATDPIIVVALHKAMRFDKAKAKAQTKRSPKAKTRQKGPRTTIKAKASADKPSKANRKANDIRQRISTMNDPEAIADMIAGRLK